MAAVDGLGHGGAAADAAALTIATLENHPDEAPEALVRRCHQLLKGTHGVVMSLASIDAREGMMAWLGVGNVENPDKRFIIRRSCARDRSASEQDPAPVPPTLHLCFYAAARGRLR